MNRTIKFRGKRIEDGRWIYGHLADESFINNIHEVARPCEEIDPATVGQFTGLLDKNGTEIYEGDKVRYYDDIEDETLIAPVIYHTASCSFCFQPIRFGDPVGLCAYWQYEVFGNIHDNPEMMG